VSLLRLVVYNTFALALGARVIVVHLVPAEASGVAEFSAGGPATRSALFDLYDWTPGPQAVPVLDGCPK
jgi:hypothetical protein